MLTFSALTCVTDDTAVFVGYRETVHHLVLSVGCSHVRQMPLPAQQQQQQQLLPVAGLSVLVSL